MNLTTFRLGRLDGPSAFISNQDGMVARSRSEMEGGIDVGNTTSGSAGGIIQRIGCGTRAKIMMMQENRERKQKGSDKANSQSTLQRCIGNDIRHRFFQGRGVLDQDIYNKGSTLYNK